MCGGDSRRGFNLAAGRTRSPDDRGRRRNPSIRPNPRFLELWLAGWFSGPLRGRIIVQLSKTLRCQFTIMQKRFWILQVGILVLCATAATLGTDETPSANNLGPIRVAVFCDAGVSEKVSVLIELLNRSPDVSVTSLKGQDIRDGKLQDFDVVVFPGGSGSKEAAALQAPGREAVQSFVKKGGGYLGICAGAYLASADYEWSLHILDAKVLDRAHWARGSGDVELELTESGRAVLAADSARQTILYWQGPLLAPAGKPEIPDYETLGSFATEIAKNGAPKGIMIGTTAIARGTFGAGRVFCFSPHPERTLAVEGQVLKAIRWAAKNSGQAISRPRMVPVEEAN